MNKQKLQSKVNFTSSAEYWKNRTKDRLGEDWGGIVPWLEGYKLSINHPHRQLILDALKQFKFNSLLEVGCCTAPNLARIANNYPYCALFGTDINQDAIREAERLLPNVLFEVGEVTDLSFKSKTFDVVLADAVLMYVDDIEKALKEMDRVCKKGIIILDWFGRGKTNYSWKRNYGFLLARMGFKVQAIKLTKGNWDNPNWIKNGYIWIAKK